VSQVSLDLNVPVLLCWRTCWCCLVWTGVCMVCIVVDIMAVSVDAVCRTLLIVPFNSNLLTSRE